MQGVDVHARERPALRDRVALAIGKREVEGLCFLSPQGLGLDGPLVGRLTHGATAHVAQAGRMRRCSHGEVKVVDPGRDVNRVRKAREKLSNGHDE